MTIRPLCNTRVIHCLSKAPKHLLRHFDALLVPDCYVDSHCKHLWRMWLSLCVCLGARVQVHTAEGVEGGWGGVDLVSANPRLFPDAIVVAVVSDHPLSRMARGQLLRPSQATTSVNICCTAFPSTTGVLACAATAASPHSGAKCQWRHKLRAGRPHGANKSAVGGMRCGQQSPFLSFRECWCTDILR